MVRITGSVKEFNEYAIYIIAFINLLIRLLLMCFTDETDSDAVSRVFTSWEWAKAPFWYKTSIWAPFHYYLIGSGFLIWKDIILLPKVLNILISVLMLFPFYYFVKREFSREGAVYATLILAFSPLLMRLGFLSLAETPGLLFMVLCMNLLSKGMRESKIQYIILAGISMTIAAGFRFESWLMILLFTLMVILSGRIKDSLIFLFSAMLFPAIWMIQNHLVTGDFLYSFHANNDWVLKTMGNNDNVDFENYIRRIWFYPFSIFIALGPVVTWLILKQLSVKIRFFRFTSFPDLWILPGFIFLIVVLYNAISGNLMLQHRFSGTLVVLFLPWIAVVMHDFKKKTIRLATLSIVLMLGLSFVYSIGGVSPVPRLKNQSVKELAQIISLESSSDGWLIVDFTGWEETWYIGLHSGFKPSNIVMLGGETHLSFPSEQITELLKSSVDKIFVIRQGSVLDKFIKDNPALVVNETVLSRENDLRIVRAGAK